MARCLACSADNELISARLNPEIPYSLLAFYPTFYLTDLPTTPKDLALDAGVKHVRLGNEHLLK